MLPAGPAVKVTIYLNRDTGSTRGFLVDDLLAFLQEQEVAGATVLQAHAGYGVHRHLHTSGAGDVAGLHLPVLVQFIEQTEKFDRFQGALLSLVTDGLVEVQPTLILKHESLSAKVIS